MSERIRESLSALMDDEADDLELARVLKAMGEDDDVSGAWSRYHLVSAVLRGGDAATIAARDAKALDVAVDLGDGADAASTPVAEASGEDARSLRGWMSFAAASTITLAIVLGFQWQGAGGLDAVTTAEAGSADLGPVRSDARGVLAASEGGASAPAVRSPEIRFSPSRLEASRSLPASEAARQIDAYMLYHAEFSAANSSAGMVPFARYASFEGER